MTTWRQELTDLLNAHPGAAERVAVAFDEGRIDGYCWGHWNSTVQCGCLYGHVYQDRDGARAAAGRHRLEMGLTPLERRLCLAPAEVRSAVLQWLAEHGGPGSKR